ncbi:MAG TPA: [FeFe] hydrogenase H-cluster radical SAM maturase HydE [Bacteroidales bacterium]|nr:[FeFe] hydrogenase H-cluster radical SAM maturase HydE [Bacteroidales bacterium]HOH21983.1 [FeFe] hydrogenase H-cluster radical SAM maturase HydE [Bacteroidales bacterium]HPB57239.1 [FeFe] hydrogenase H-cluster radical SAM maturase HydE [Bacteroidales bacterium]HPZ03486.1 [FeFe] hydrogenase H-cluster radical SAM maturase HydE [Bacteroidales bacterium]HQB74904.1 [FeFe] hydrogenase H-cluster radical SAM maturase HydE [Bacteroidales bacterium]
MREIIDKLASERRLTKQEWVAVIENRTPELAEYLFKKARQEQAKHYGNEIFIRGLIEFTNYCRNNCFYCGIRAGNRNIERYRLTKEEILECCELGDQIGFRTFVLQGGEDMHFTTDEMLDIITNIKKRYPEHALTLSVGERDYDTYLAFFNAGADRYLLRHETANKEHYDSLHPKALSHARRRECLSYLKKIGYETGTGFMVGSPGQTAEHLAEDMLFITDFDPDMIGIGPFLPHHDTPFAHEKAGTVELTLYMIGLIRLLIPSVLLPATTALGSAEEAGRSQAVLAGANVIMPNLSPLNVRKKYLLYDNKISTGVETAEGITQLAEDMEKIGYKLVFSRGDRNKSDI